MLLLQSKTSRAKNASIPVKSVMFLFEIFKLIIFATSFVAILGAAGLAVGLALQGSLSNFAGGALILFFKPFRVGDIIEAQGYTGKVQEIQIFITKLLTPDNKTVIIPNGELSNGNIVNYSEEGKIRIDLTVGISYDADIKKAKKVALKTIEKIDGVLEDPGVTVVVTELADSSVNLGIRPWVNIADYWRVYSESLEGIKNAFDKADIGIPYPHQVVHMINKDN